MRLFEMTWYASLAMRYVFGDYELDEQLYELRCVGESLKLDRKVFDVLTYLIQHRNRLVTKDELLDKLWPGQVVGEAALTRCITSARKALGDDGTRQEFIKTQHGRGYRFVAAVTTTPPSSLESSVQSLESENHNSSPEAVQAPGSRHQAGSLDVAQHNPGEEEKTTPRIPLRSIQATESAATVRSWPRRGLILASVLLLVGVTVMVLYVSRQTLSTQDSGLGTEETQPPTLPLPDKPSIIVLPFVNLSIDPEQEYFSDGFTDDLITDLSRIPQLFVIARHSAFSYKGRPARVQEISREMGVQYVLEGSVRRADGRVRITTQLADATTGEQLWAERYDRPLQDIFALQDEIRQKIVLALKVKLTSEEQERFRRVPTGNLEAYDYWLRGHDLSLHSLHERKKEANEQAQQMYEKAVELDSQYAGAYAWLAWTYFQDAFYLWSKDRSHALNQASKLAQQAVALENSSSTAHWILGMVFLWQKQHDQAIAEGERAIALDANDADSYVSLGNTLVFAGRPAEGIELIKKAMRLNPRYPPRYLNLLGLAYRMAGRCEEVLVALEKAVTLEPNFYPAHYNLAACYADLGRLKEAQSEMAEILRINPFASLENHKKFMPYKNSADMERNLAALRKAGLK